MNTSTLVTQIPLCRNQIAQELESCCFHKPYQLHLFHAIDSTNTYLKQLPASGVIDICCGEVQTQGRGRFGRQWHAPTGENICCSLRWPFQGDLSHISGLSLVASLAIVSTLKQYINTSKLKIKWPNDILFDNKKLCGCLIETVLFGSDAQIILGVGLNTNTDTIKQPLSDKVWCSLFEISGHTFNRNTIIASLVNTLNSYFELYINQGWEVFSGEWSANDYLVGRNITLFQGTKYVIGIAQGVNALGQLILENEYGEKQPFSSGDVTIKSI